MFPQLLGSQNDMAKVRLFGGGGGGEGCASLPGSRRPSGLRKTTCFPNSLAHRTTWLRSDFTKDELESGIAFVTIGAGRLYHERKKYHLTAEDLSNYATSSLMFSFCHCSQTEINKALEDGQKIIETADMENVHHAIDTMFDEGKEIIS